MIIEYIVTLLYVTCVQELMCVYCCLYFQHGGANITKLQLRMSLYDNDYKQFFGRTWIGPFTDIKRGSKLAYNQVQCCKNVIRRITNAIKYLIIVHLVDLLNVKIHWLQLAATSVIAYCMI